MSSPLKGVLLSLLLVGCNDSNDSNQSLSTGVFDPFSDTQKQALLTQLVTQIVPTHLQRFNAATHTLVSTVTAWCEAPDNIEKQSAAHSAWQSAMDVWQQVSVVQVGAISDPQTAYGENIYSWPLRDSCRIDKQVFLGVDSEETISGLIPKSRGLDALEYVLFESNLTVSCSSQAELNGHKVVGWNDLLITERQAGRCVFAKAVAQDMETQSAALLEAWQNQSVASFTVVGAGKDFASYQSALNHVSDGVFFIDKVLKDLKVAKPAGMIDCDSATCVESVEMPYAKTSKEAIIQNLEGFKTVFTGGDGVGFDDWLIAQGEAGEALSSKILADVDAAIESAKALAGDFKTAVTHIDQDACVNGTDPVCVLHSRIKAVTGSLKGDFVTLLNLTLPVAAVSDND